MKLVSMRLHIPAEPIGSIPRSIALIEAVAPHDNTDPELRELRPASRFLGGA